MCTIVIQQVYGRLAIQRFSQQHERNAVIRWLGGRRTLEGSISGSSYTTTVAWATVHTGVEHYLHWGVHLTVASA